MVRRIRGEREVLRGVFTTVNPVRLPPRDVSAELTRYGLLRVEIGE